MELKDHEKFELIEGLVFRKRSDKPRFVPESMTVKVIRIYHDEMNHCGKNSPRHIGTNYWFSLLKKKVRNYIENCITCLMTNSSVNSCEGNMQITDIPSSSLEIIHIDHFGPLKESSN